MAFDVVAMNKKNTFSVDVINRSLCHFFNCTANIEMYAENRYEFTGFYEKDDIILYFIDNCSCEIWDSFILKKEYSYLQSLIFGISKFSYLPETFEIVFRFLIELQKTYHSEMLITSDIHEDICYINTDSEKTWVNHCGYVKELIKYGDLIIDKTTGTIIKKGD